MLSSRVKNVSWHFLFLFSGLPLPPSHCHPHFCVGGQKSAYEGRGGGKRGVSVVIWREMGENNNNSNVFR